MNYTVVKVPLPAGTVKALRVRSLDFFRQRCSRFVLYDDNMELVYQGAANWKSYLSLLLHPSTITIGLSPDSQIVAGEYFLCVMYPGEWEWRKPAASPRGFFCCKFDKDWKHVC